MQMQSLLFQYFMSLVVSAPMLLVLVIGFILGVIQIRKLPQVGLFIAVGTGLFLINFIVLNGVQSWLVFALSNGRNPETIQVFLQVLGVLRGLFSAAATGLLIAAALVGRNASASRGK